MHLQTEKNFVLCSFTDNGVLIKMSQVVTHLSMENRSRWSCLHNRLGKSDARLKSVNWGNSCPQAPFTTNLYNVYFYNSIPSSLFFLQQRSGTVIKLRMCYFFQHTKLAVQKHTRSTSIFLNLASYYLLYPLYSVYFCLWLQAIRGYTPTDLILWTRHLYSIQM